MSPAGEGWSASVSSWAEARADIRALVQIGSRVQPGAAVDAWSDYDYQLVTSDPGRYLDGSFARELGSCWAFGSQVAFGNAVKVTAVFDGALEADFVILSHWEVRLALAAAAFPSAEAVLPAPLKAGVAGLRIVAAPGWKVIKGGPAWERRYARLKPLRPALDRAEFDRLVGEFWTQLVWAWKKAERGEYRASQRALHLHLLENTLRLMQEEAALDGRASFPLARRAESWLAPEQLAGTDAASRPEKAALLSCLRQVADAFEASSSAVAARRGWELGAHPDIRGWLNR